MIPLGHQKPTLSPYGTIKHQGSGVRLGISALALSTIFRVLLVGVVLFELATGLRVANAQTGQPQFQVDAVVQDVLPQPDGKIIVPSESIRLNLDGTPDQSFKLVFDGKLQASALQSDGKFLIAHSDGIDDFYERAPVLHRFNADGSIDNTFAATIPDVQVIAGVVVQNDSRVLVAGYSGLQSSGFDPSLPPLRLKLFRLNVNGSRDPTFNAADTRATGAKPSFAIQPNDGKILVPTGDTPHLLRLNADGSLDSAFSPPPNYAVFNLVVRSDGKIVVGGTFPANGGATPPGIARLRPDGSIDTTFSPPSGYVFDHAALGLQPDGKVLACVFSASAPGFSIVLRLQDDGSTDSSYNAPVQFSVNSIALEADGKALIAGSFENIQGEPRTGFARLNTNGSVDTAFYPIFTRPGAVLTLAAQGDKVIAGGGFSRVNGPFTGSIVRILSDGSLDNTYHIQKVAGNTFHAEVQSDGRILISNDIVPEGSSFFTGLRRLTVDGDIDPTFTPSTASVFSVFTLQSPTEKILGLNNNAVFRLNTDGSPDPTFSTFQYRRPINGLKTQSDGRFFVFGLNKIDRLSQDGQFDPTFHDPGSNKSVEAVGLQSDGKVVVAGDFQYFGQNADVFGSTITRPYVARLENDGAVDEAFNVSVNSPVSTVCVQKSGKIVIGGSFTFIDGYAVPGVARLNSDGSLDTTFQVATNGGTVRAIVETASGTVTVGGDFGVVTSVITPLNGQFVSTNTSIPFASLVVAPSGRNIEEVRFLVNGNVVALERSPLAFQSGNTLPANAHAENGGIPDFSSGVYGTVFTLATAGTYILTVEVRDSAGNVSTSSESTVTALDSTQEPPPVTFQVGSLLTGQVLLTNHSIIVSASPVTQIGSALSKVALFVNGTQVQQIKVPISSSSTSAAGTTAGTYNFTFTPLASRSYGLVVVATATNGVTTSSPTIAVTSAPPSSNLANISTRLNVLTDNNVLIGGFIVTGSAPKRVMLRAMGPSLSGFGVAGALADPTLELHKPDGSVLTNDNWKIDDTTGQSQETTIRATTIQPSDDLESAMVQTLVPGAYTVIVRGNNGGTGVGVIEAFDLDQLAASQLANISSRGFVGNGSNVMIGGFIVGGGGGSKVVVRAIGPSLAQAGISNALADPTLELHNADGTMVVTNDNWKINDSTGGSQEIDIRATKLMPSNDLESAILVAIPPGPYTAIVAGKGGGTGVGLIEAYNLQ